MRKTIILEMFTALLPSGVLAQDCFRFGFLTNPSITPIKPDHNQMVLDNESLKEGDKQKFTLSVTSINLL